MEKFNVGDEIGHDLREGVSIDRNPFFASHSIVSYARPLQRRLELLQY